MGGQRKVQSEMTIDPAAKIRAVHHRFSVQLEVVKVDKHKKLAVPDLRHGVKGSVAVKDTNENFAGKPPDTIDSGSIPASPDVGVPAAGQTSHE
jgi:hypothetical protein